MRFIARTATAAHSNYLLKNFDLSKYSNAKKAVKYFSSFVEDIISLNEYLVDSPIGGCFQYETAISDSTDNFQERSMQGREAVNDR